MNDRDEVTNLLMMELCGALQKLGIKEISFIEPNGIRFIRRGYQVDWEVKIRKDDGKRLMG